MTDLNYPFYQGPLRVGIVAGEASGDILGASLIKSLKKRFPTAVFEGIGGPLMEAEGFRSHVPMERLSVMGLVEVLGRLRELLGVRKQLFNYFTQTPPHIFIGIDAPDFNLELEYKLKQAGITTVHYVSPSVWAWRQGRVKKIAQSVDHMLTLLPFEAAFYQQYQVPVTFVGHPLADEIPLQSDQAAARQQLQLPANDPVIALLPGSRGSEIKQLGQLFLATFQRCLEQYPSASAVLPCANDARKKQLEALLNLSENAAVKNRVKLIDGQADQAMVAADTVLVASGTATLQGMLLKRPMVMAYRLAPITYQVLRWLVKAPYVALPNLLAERQVMPEFIQTAATVENLAQATLANLAGSNDWVQTEALFLKLHQELRCQASEKAAHVVSQMIADQFIK
ncbi:lipid-A-disaccharide synthase [Endozoicomonas sp. SM1973]|uniref:Lipid-A-disaccharide synthase n=1 Tax=Spartinivicinus marinus TaxID=2994442 RepID=A0A853HU86_9GAMM|nr:lipid-A-disaccharide synthase [Spartinivicinus marinus]MCX4025441.1 lipid-A-disaccharide synthase [Spartinivicinus marinus]NYZ65330.1 lipid-A-disaccharide synthase [Spartinivicinus marinus]